MTFAIASVEIALLAGLLAMVATVRLSRRAPPDLISGLALGLFAITLILIWLGPDGQLIGNTFVVDPFARLMKTFALASAAAALACGIDFLKREGYDNSATPLFVVLMAFGMCVSISATSTFLLFIGLEVMSWALVGLMRLHRKSSRARNAFTAALQSVVLSSLLIFMGGGLILAGTGEASFGGISGAIQTSGPPFVTTAGLVFLVCGLLVKLSAVPFHIWAPDIAEGAPTPIVLFVLIVPASAVFSVMARLVIDAFQPVVDAWQGLLMLVAAGSMLLAALASLKQTNIKRLMGNSAIGHIGFALMGLTGGSQSAAGSLVIYVFAYLVCMFGIFACIILMRTRDGMLEDIGDLSGLARESPQQALLLTFLLLSLAGLPPFIGFFAKYAVLLAAMEAGLVFLAVIALAALVIGLVPYVRMVQLIYVKEPMDRFETPAIELRMIFTIGGIFALLASLAGGPVTDWAREAASSLF